jgi:hypothetical protein
VPFDDFLLQNKVKNQKEDTLVEQENPVCLMLTARLTASGKKKHKSVEERAALYIS